MRDALTLHQADIANCAKRDFMSGKPLPELAKGDVGHFIVLDNSARQVNCFKEFVGWSWDKLFARSLIEKHDLHFQEQQAHNDFFFCNSACCLADKIVKTNDVFIAHRKHETSIAMNRDKSPLCFSSALRGFYRKLDVCGYWSKYPEQLRYYNNYIVELGFWTIDTLKTREAIELAYAELRKMLQEQGAMCKDKVYMDLYPHWYGRYCSLCRNKDALLFWREAAIEERKSHKWLQGRFRALQRECDEIRTEYAEMKDRIDNSQTSCCRETDVIPGQIGTLELKAQNIVSKYRLSIVTVNKNNKHGLEATLRSTLECQGGFLDFEQIVVDGGSTDGSRDVIAKYAQRISWSCSETDAGIYQAMNKGVSHASGEYLLFLNSGDVLKPDCLADIFGTRFSEDIVYADMYVTANGKETLSHQVDINELTPGWFLFNTLPHQAAFIRRALHNRLGGYDESMKISAAPKFFFEAVIKQHCSIRKLATPFSVYDNTGMSTQEKWRNEKIKDWYSIWKPYFGERVADRAKEYMVTHVEYPRLRALVAAKDKRIDGYEQKIRLYKEELNAVKRSESYRVGLLVTWPVRKLYNMTLKKLGRKDEAI